MSEAPRVGVLGGTFDPPHVGHLIVAQDVYEGLGLDRLVIVPAARPPHREPELAAEERLALVREAFEGDARFEVSEIELRREGPSWTVRTLERLRTELEAADLFLVIGVDQYRTFAGWRDPDRIVRLARLVVLPRHGDLPEPDARFPFETVPVTRVDVSSTRVRERLDAGLTVRYLVPETIRERLETSWNRRSAPVPEGWDSGRGTRESED
jgi:nicotinate-nucleotide adenylyltransferase